MIGTDTVWQHTYQTENRPHVFGGQSENRTGLGTTRQVEEFRIHPNVRCAAVAATGLLQLRCSTIVIKDLSTGVAVLITKILT